MFFVSCKPGVGPAIKLDVLLTAVELFSLGKAALLTGACRLNLQLEHCFKHSYVFVSPRLDAGVDKQTRPTEQSQKKKANARNSGR